MSAKSLLKERRILSENSFLDLVIWELPEPAPGSEHNYKYRLAFIVDNECVLRYDNESGKGDHKHIMETEVIEVQINNFQDSDFQSRFSPQTFHDRNDPGSLLKVALERQANRLPQLLKGFKIFQMSRITLGVLP